MNEERVIALAGLFQATALVRALATTGNCDATALEASIASVLLLDSDAPADVFGGVGGVRYGLKTLISQIDDGTRDITVTQIAVTVLRLERKLARRRAMLETLREGITAAQRQVDHLGTVHASVLGRLSELYSATLSTLRPRIVVSGNPLYLTQASQVERIRATLLAAVRAAVLWRQLGGNQWQLIFKRRQCAMLARGLLAGSQLG
ncbi:MAG TPA: high frequency lysogenization protein HflD [Tahibacter sp.]|nr:high frequency lysogenization protein HflD [Tahibacter sp.]